MHVGWLPMTDNHETVTLTHDMVADAIHAHTQPFVSTGTLQAALEYECDRPTLLQCLNELVLSGQLQCRSVHDRLLWYPAD